MINDEIPGSRSCAPGMNDRAIRRRQTPRPPSRTAGLGIGGCLGSGRGRPGGRGGGAAGSGWLGVTGGVASRWSTRKLTSRARSNDAVRLFPPLEQSPSRLTGEPPPAESDPDAAAPAFGAIGLRLNFRPQVARPQCRRNRPPRRLLRGLAPAEFVDDRSGQTVLRPAAPPASAATPATPWAPLAAGCGVIRREAGRVGRLALRFVVVGVAFFGDHAGNGDCLKCQARGVMLFARWPPFAHLAGTTAAPAAALALVAIRFSLTAAVFAGRESSARPFALLCFHFGFDLDVDRLVLVERFL